ncbi:MAG: PEP-CTERM sorting domain-containing protein [Terracidiphilus sp.]|jgi:hypothetical protein
MITLVTLLTARADPFTWTSPGKTPDFGQEYNSAWGDGWCAPTAAGDAIYWLSQSNSSLLQGYLPGNNTGASTIISELGAYMGTTPSGGTSDTGMVTGLDTYLGLYGGSQAYSVTLTYADQVGGGLNLLADMENDLMAGEDILPLIGWDYSDTGHAVEMTGWNTSGITINDPVTDANQLNWSNENLTATTTGYGADGIGISYVTGTGVIEGFVGIDPVSSVPEPGTLFLVGLGMTVLSRRVRRVKG